MENSYGLEYTSFLLNEAYNQSKMSYIINSTILVNESTSLEALSEGALDSIKKFIDGIIQAIAGAWGKFLNWIGEFTTDNNKYLEKNKDIILEKKLKKATFKDWYDYDIARIQKPEVPELNLNTMKSIVEAQKPKVEFINKYFADYKSDNEDESFSNIVKNKLKGEAKEVKETDIKIEDMYNYCYKYNTTTKDELNKEIEMVKKSNNAAYAVINKLARTKDKPGEIKEESFNFKSTLSYYFNEADIVDEEPKEEEKKDDNSSSNNDSTNNDADTRDTAKAENDKEEEFIKTYFTVCSQFLGSKLSVAQEAYKSYMKVIKWHVKKYKKDDEPEKKKEENTEEKKDDNSSSEGGANANNDVLDNAGKNAEDKK